MPDIQPQANLLDLAYPYALDALLDEDRRAVEHILSHADETTAAAFRATVRDLREILATMTVIDAVPAPPNVEATLLRVLDEQTTVIESTAAQTTAHARRLRSLRRLMAAAALIVAIALGVGVALYRSQSHDSTAVTAQQVFDDSDRRTETVPVTGGGTITVNASRQLDAAVVSFDAVPTPPAGRAYQVWLIPEGGQLHSVAVLDTLPTSRAPMVMRLDNAQQLALSVEPAGGSPLPTTQPIVAVPLG